MRIAALLAAILLASLWPARPILAQHPETNFVQVNDVAQLLEKWTPSVHLYVLGQLPATSDAELRELGGWLNGKHWYVVLARTANGQVYVDTVGRQHAGVDALDFALGRGIGDKPAFAALTNPKTKQPDGAILGIYLDNRKLFLRTSEAHDLRGMSGERNFANNLDEWAKTALRSQGPRGVVPAVKDTVVNVDARLDAAIAGEAEAGRAALNRATAKVAELQSRLAALQQTDPTRKDISAGVDLAALQSHLKSAQAALDAGQPLKAQQLSGPVLKKADSALTTLEARENSRRQAQAALATAGARLKELAGSSQAFVKGHPNLSGDLARVDLAGLNAAKDSAQGELDANPVRAKELAQGLERKIIGIAEAIARYPSAGNLLKEEQERLAALEGRPHAREVQSSLVEAKQALADAVKAHSQGDSTYVTLGGQAKTALDGAERAVGNAEAAAARVAEQAARDAAMRRTLFWLFTILAALALAVVLVLMNRSARRYQAEAKKLLSDWRLALREKLEILHGDFDDNYRTWIVAHQGKCSGDSQRLLEQARVSRGWVAIVWAMSQDRLKQVQGLVEGGPFAQAYGQFLSSNFRRALGFENEKVRFRPDDEALLRELFGKERTWEDKLLGNVHDYAPFEASFSELVDQLNSHLQTVLSAVKQMESCSLGLEPKLEAIDVAAQDLQTKKGSIEQQAGDGLFLVPSLFAVLLPAVRAAVASSRATGKTDPIGAYRTADQVTERMLRDCQVLTDLILNARSGPLTAIPKAMHALRAREIDVGWIQADLERLSTDAEAAAAAAIVESVAVRLASLEAGIQTLGERAGRAQALCEGYGHIRERIAKAREEVAVARQEISLKTGVAADKLLDEQRWKVDDKLSRAHERAEETALSLGLGDLDGAATVLDQAREFGQQASKIVANSLVATRVYDGVMSAAKAEARRIADLIPQHQAILDRIRAGYLASVLKLGVGDVPHPKANGTLHDNIEEAGDHLDQAADRLRDAATAFQEGRVLATTGLLSQAKGHHELALHRLAEIAEKEARLKETEPANEANLLRLQNTLKEYREEIEEDPRTMRPTMEALEKAARELDAAIGSIRATKGDPFAAQHELIAVEAELECIHGTMAPNDRDLFEEATSSLKSAQEQMAPLVRLVHEATTDDVPDSEALTQAAAATARLGQLLALAQARLGERHGDWIALDQEASRIVAGAGRLAATVKGEIEKAEAAVEQLSRAADKVRSAGSWSGSHGIRVVGSPGDQHLTTARSLFSQGRYAEAQRQAEEACREAQNAIDVAAAAVAAETARLAAEESARQSAWQSSSSSDGGGFWSAASSISDFSSSSGGSSSFGDFSSGGGSSGW